MPRLKILFFTLFVAFGTILVWYWIDRFDYFKSDFRDLTPAQSKPFKWQVNDSADSLKSRFKQYFSDSNYAFPRQKVKVIVLFRNVPIISSFTSKNLKAEYVDSFVAFCNDTANFTWGETTWQQQDAQYYFRLINANGKVAGKIYFCLDNCGMTSARPFSPAMKFGQLSIKGVNYINQLIGDNTKWE